MNRLWLGFAPIVPMMVDIMSGAHWGALVFGDTCTYIHGIPSTLPLPCMVGMLLE